MNLFILGGRLTKTPELKLQNGITKTSFTIACRRNYKSKDGEYGTDFICVQAYKQRAEYITKYLKQGDFVEVQGLIQSKVVEGESGNKIDYYFKCNEISLAAHPQQKGENTEVIDSGSEYECEFDFSEDVD